MNDTKKKEITMTGPSGRVKVIFDESAVIARHIEEFKQWEEMVRRNPGVRAAIAKESTQNSQSASTKEADSKQAEQQGMFSFSGWSLLERRFVECLRADWSELLSRIRQARAASIKQPPGSRLLKLTDFFCSPKTVKLTVNPLVADWRTEYFDALKDDRKLKARWICVRYYCAFGKALALDKVLGLLKAVSSVFISG